MYIYIRQALLKDGREDKGQNSAEEEMEITWEPGDDVMIT